MCTRVPTSRSWQLGQKCEGCSYQLTKQLSAVVYDAVMSEQSAESFGSALHAAITAKHWNQARFANEFGIDAASVSRWVTNKTVPLRANVARMEALLGVSLAALFEASNPEHELYVSAPITGLSNDQMGAHHEQVAAVVAELAHHTNSVYWAGAGITDKRQLMAADIATEKNMAVMRHCRALLYLQFEELTGPSGSLIELGMALGRKTKTTMIIRRGLRTPFMLENFSAVAARTDSLPEARIYLVDSAEAAAALISNNGRSILGLL